MNGRDFTREQLDQLATKVREMNAWLYALKSRMECRGFTPDDELFRSAAEASLRVHDLNVRLHYLSCDKARQG